MPDRQPPPTPTAHQERIDHATWIIARERENRCICLTCWQAHLAKADLNA